MSRKLKAGGSPLSNDMDVKHATLMRDYLQLQHEFDTLKDRISAAQARKATVFAEVRFLRRRLKKLKESPSNSKDKYSASPISHYPSSTAYGGKSTSGAFAPEPASRSPKNNLLGTMEIPVSWEPLRTKYPDEVTKKKPVSSNVELLSALKTSELRNRSNMFATALPGKRKISWQDQISLECN
ncbi:hypothetical protein SUGI_0995990 [Cryptomeria japonica]|uniref:uncharacterized protein LOC131060657 n=1 Tax=Cryptomeria japonica TaxID=3369 RepID=UPI002414A949|nr:uncharacterized protein LOC131060657 [Cryptomeria japonica]GLJ47182.1 hypothetical protein SUGI_0995990 [Cryptomeria japonica]